MEVPQALVDSAMGNARFILETGQDLVPVMLGIKEDRIFCAVSTPFDSPDTSHKRQQILQAGCLLAASRVEGLIAIQDSWMSIVEASDVGIDKENPDPGEMEKAYLESDLPRPSDDPKAIEVLTVTWVSRDGDLGSWFQEYHRRDDGTIEFEEVSQRLAEKGEDVTGGVLDALKQVMSDEYVNHFPPEPHGAAPYLAEHGFAAVLYYEEEKEKDRT